MMDNLFTWLFWASAAVISYSALVASINYVKYWRQGARIMAAQAILQTVLCMSGLVVLWVIHRFYMPE
jgi:hypothetical protein